MDSPVLGVLEQPGLPVLELAHVQRGRRASQGFEGLFVERGGLKAVDLDKAVVVEGLLLLQLEGTEALDDGALGCSGLGLSRTHGV